MEPITHFMTGAVLARAGLNRKAAYATLAMTLAAEAPDLDVLWAPAGPIVAFQHHRGITHTFVGLPFEAAIVVGAVWLLHRWRLARQAPTAAPNPASELYQPVRHALTAAPVRWAALYGFTLLALLSHIFLDWTNNYGIRPFFPFNPRWYSGSFVFIFEPVLFVILLAALVLPGLFSLVSSEVGVRWQPFRGRRWSVAALLAMAVLWSTRFIQHADAVSLAESVQYGPDGTVLPLPSRVSASPYPIDPFRWHIVVETPDFYQLATADTLHGTMATPISGDIYFKPPTTLATLVAKRSLLGQVYLDWSSYPLVTDVGRTASLPDGVSRVPLTAVTFQDLRFRYSVPFLDGRSKPPLTGAAYLNDDRRVVLLQLGGKTQK